MTLRVSFTVQTPEAAARAHRMRLIKRLAIGTGFIATALFVPSPLVDPSSPTADTSQQDTARTSPQHVVVDAPVLSFCRADAEQC